MLSIIRKNTFLIPRKIRIKVSVRLGTANYHEAVIDHYENPRNVGSLDKDNINIGTGLVGAPACG